MDKNLYNFGPAPIPPPAAPSAPRPIEKDVFCFKCGYNLRALLPGARCPECGSPIDQSLLETHLAASAPEWVNTLRIAMLIRIIAITLNFIIMGIVVFTLFRFKGASSHLRDFLSLVRAGLSLISIWMLTAQEPRVALADRFAARRTALRIFSVINIASTLAYIINGYLPSNVAEITAWILDFLGLPGTWLFYLHLSDLALRIPHPSLALQSRILMWAFTICEGILSLLILLARLPQLRLLVCVALPVMLALVALGVWSTVLYVQFYRVFTFCTRQARARVDPLGPGHSIYQ